MNGERPWRLHRSYYTPALLMKMGRVDTEACRRGCGERGTFLHVLWGCGKLSEFWSKIQATVTALLGEGDIITPRLALLNIWKPTDLGKADRIWLTRVLMVARRNIVRLWGAVSSPTVLEWEKDLDWCMMAEKIAYEGRGCPRKWSKIWGKWNAQDRKSTRLKLQSQR